MTQTPTIAAGLAAAASLGLHLAGFGLMATPAPEAPQVKGGAAAQVALLGNSFADMAASTASPERVEQVEAPVDTAMTQPPVTPTPVKPTTDIAQAAPAKPLPAVPALPLSAVKPVVAAQTPPPPAETVTARTSVEVTVARADTPRPTPRPAAQPVKKPTVAPKPAKPPSAASQAARKGQADGKATAKAATAAAKPAATASAAGNATVSSYPGQVMRKIARTRKERAGARGKAVVGFQIGANGALSSVRILRSSGTSRVDRVALKHIQRAAPFPPPPKGAQRTFKVEFLSEG